MQQDVTLFAGLPGAARAADGRACASPPSGAPVASQVAERSGRCVPQVQGRAKGRHVMAVASQNPGCERQKVLLFVSGMGGIAVDQCGQRYRIDHGWPATRGVADSWLQDLPRRLDASVLGHQSMDQGPGLDGLIPGLGTFLHRREKFVFFVGMVLFAPAGIRW